LIVLLAGRGRLPRWRWAQSRSARWLSARWPLVGSRSAVPEFDEWKLAIFSCSDYGLSTKVGCPPSSPSAANSHGIVNLASPYPFPETVSRLQSAFVDHGIKIFATVDQQAEALAAGLEMPPTTLIIFGNPKSGTPVMLAQPLSALDLPLKVLVSEPIAGTGIRQFQRDCIPHRQIRAPTGTGIRARPGRAANCRCASGMSGNRPEFD
jgi:hypothetical protein